jgi:hypothetical protein
MAISCTVRRGAAKPGAGAARCGAVAEAREMRGRAPPGD